MRKTLAALAATAAVTLGSSAPSHATATVNVQLAIGAVVGLPAGLCNLQVPAGADGLAVLDAGIANDCIESYKTTTYDSGAFVDCINDICGAPAEAAYITYWGMFENGVATWYGVSDFTAEEGDVLGFSYTTWATFLVPTP